MPLSIGLVGYGHFGAFLHTLQQRFLPDAVLKVHSGRREPDGVLFFPLEEVAACDAVVLSVPISAYEATLARVAPHMKPDGIVVDIATVKQHTMDLVRKLRPGRPFVAMHPMFGPESYAKRGGDVGDLRIVITGHGLAPAHYELLRERLSGVGFSVIEKTAEAHDRDLAETLFLTHYVGQVIARGGFERTDIDTVSFGFLMDAVDSVRHDGQLFEEVCRFNPYCAEVIERFDRSDRQVREAMLGLPPLKNDRPSTREAGSSSGLSEGPVTADDIVDFWSSVEGPGVHPADGDTLPAESFATQLYPLPWIGRIRDAKAYVLLLNPGLSPEDERYETERSDFRNTLHRNLRGEADYVYLMPEFDDHPGHRWAYTTFGPDISERDRDRICVLQLVPYHSANGAAARRIAPTLPSSIAMQRFVRDTLLPRAMAGEVALVVARSQKLWGVTDAEETGAVVIYRGWECRRAFQTAESRGGKVIRRFGLGKS